MTEAQKALPAPEEKTCFVVMPIADMTGYDAGHFGRVYANIIKPACITAGFKPVRADEVQNAGMIHIDILNHLLDADMVICDLSGKNANVMFELGIRQAFNKPVVLIQDKGTSRIFDISPMRCIDYDKDMRYDTVLPVQEKIVSYITQTYEKRDSTDNINSIVGLLSISRAAELPKASGSSEDNMLRMIMARLDRIDNTINENKIDSDFCELESVYHECVSLLNNERDEVVIGNKFNKILSKSKAMLEIKPSHLNFLYFEKISELYQTFLTNRVL